MKIENKRKLYIILAVASGLILALALIPLMLLGNFSHPLGDDFCYGKGAYQALSDSNIFNAILAAANGTALEYGRWQGTYSAMFLMHLPPQIFGDFFYKLYPTVLLICLIAGLFVLIYTIMVDYLKTTREEWIIIASLIGLLFIEQVPLMGETFYWYNGSMYYTGFFALTLFFFGLLGQYILKGKLIFLPILSFIGFFLAGGNYASLLPSILIIIFLEIILIINKADKKKIIGIAIILAFIMIGFMISVLAPGNELRQATSYGTTAPKAIAKSIIQAISFLKGWNSVYLYAGLIAVTPLFVRIAKKAQFSFKYPILLSGISFGIFASASCPTYYAQNNGGAARVFDLSWYMMVLLMFGVWFYVIGFFTKKAFVKDKTLTISAMAVLVIIFALLQIVSPFRISYIELNSIKALKSIVNGEASYYESQYQTRLDMLASDEEDIVFRAYDVPDRLMYVLWLGDLSTDPSEQVNVEFAEYYGKNSVRIEE